MGYMDTLKLTYNANNELEKTVRIHQQGFEVVTTTTTYHYDAFGRRVAKHSDTQKKTKLTASNNLLPFEKAYQTNKTNKSTTLMLWDGNRQAQEYTDTHVFTTVYDQDSFEPVARLVWLKPSLLEASNDDVYTDKPNTPNNPIQIYHYHNDHLGTPNELTNNQGEVVWLADYEAWGNTAKVIWHEVELQQIQIAKDELQPIRFQGQYVDQETGLHYNRFRYYDPDVGMFISRDPIGLMGGFNVFQYAPNPVMWVDPFGLKKLELYALIAKSDGMYPVMEWGKKDPVGEIFLKKGEIWKFGETTMFYENGNQRRYTLKWLNNTNLKYQMIKDGFKDINQPHIRKYERVLIKLYKTAFGRRPPGNKCNH